MFKILLKSTNKSINYTQFINDTFDEVPHVKISIFFNEYPVMFCNCGVSLIRQRMNIQSRHFMSKNAFFLCFNLKGEKDF